MVCQRCGFKNGSGSRFCRYCGFAIEPAPPAGAPAASADLFDSFAKRLHNLASTERLEGFSIPAMFSDVFRHRTPEEIEEYFLTGTSRATPPIEAVESGWPRPWFFFRALIFVVVVYFGFSFLMQQFGNTKMIPGMILMGALAFPLATLILFFECNTPRNVTLHSVIVMMAFGGMASLALTHFGNRMADLRWLGAMSAGIVEESAKLLTVILLARQARHKYILNGLLFGAAVGAGFEVFEIAGYAFDRVMATRTLSVMEYEIHMRAFTAPFGHAAWTAIAAGALWRAKADSPLSPMLLADGRFFRAFLIPVGLHMFYNSPLPSPFFLKETIVAVVSWFTILGLMQQGLRQVRAEQRAVAQRILATAG